MEELNSEYKLVLSSGKYRFTRIALDDAQCPDKVRLISDVFKDEHVALSSYQLEIVVDNKECPTYFIINLVTNGQIVTPLYSDNLSYRNAILDEENRIKCVRLLSSEDINEIRDYVYNKIYTDVEKMQQQSEKVSKLCSDAIDIGFILEHCSAGTKLYSKCYGDVIFDRCDPVNLDMKLTPMIHCHTLSGNKKTFFRNGRISPNGEVMLFPSKDNLDWSTFTTPHVYYKNWDIKQ